jgi:hypothetical protein
LKVGFVAVRLLLVKEVTLVGEVHGDARLCSSSDNFWVSLRTSGLNHGGYACVDQNLKSVGKREEGVGCRDGTLGSTRCSLNGKAAGVNSVYLTHADANRGTVLG